MPLNALGQWWVVPPAILYDYSGIEDRKFRRECVLRESVDVWVGCCVEELKKFDE